MKTKTKLAIGYLSACAVSLIAAGTFVDTGVFLFVGSAAATLLVFVSIGVVLDHRDEVKRKQIDDRFRP